MQCSSCNGEIVVFQVNSEYDMMCVCQKCGKLWQYDTRLLKDPDTGEPDFKIDYSQPKPKLITT